MLTVWLAGCNRSAIPFMRELGIHADTLIMNRVPQPLPADSCGLRLSAEQREQLLGNLTDGLPYPQVALLSAQQFGSCWLLAYTFGNGIMRFVLYDANGRRLDSLSGGLWLLPEAPAKPDKYGVVKVSVRALGDGIEGITQGEYRRLGKSRFQVWCKFAADTIVRTYCVTNHRLKLLSRQDRHRTPTPLLDILSYPVSQTYQACNHINHYKRLEPPGVIVDYAPPVKHSFPFNVYYRNPAAMWQWMYDHRDRKEDVSAQLKYVFLMTNALRKRSQDRVSIKALRQDVKSLPQAEVRKYGNAMLDEWEKEL